MTTKQIFTKLRHGISALVTRLDTQWAPGLPASLAKLPESPAVSVDGRFDLPYLFVPGGTASPAKWPASLWLWRIVSLLVLLPLFTLLAVSLSVWFFRREIKADKYSTLLQVAAFRLLTLFEDEGAPGAQKVGVFFPGKVVPWPVEVEMTLPLIVLEGQGAKLSEWCSGHGGRLPLLRFAWQSTAPISLLQLFESTGVPYEMLPATADQGPALRAVPGIEQGFLDTLAQWAAAARSAVVPNQAGL